VANRRKALRENGAPGMFSPGQLEHALAAFLSRYRTSAERIAAVRTALEGSGGKVWRTELGRWITRLVPVEQLVPPAYRDWQPLVRDAIEFYVSRLSAERLAPKVVEQIEAPPGLPAELRLLRLIARIPGLQKIGQVLARNRHFDRRFRHALSQLEDAISDVTLEEIRAIILRELWPRFEQYSVRLDSKIHSEASVSAVVGFTWIEPPHGRRERGVFKVLKPYIPACYAEDMRILQELAGFLAQRHARDRARLAALAETLTSIRALLEHEVDFPREQRCLAAVAPLYGRLPGIRIPRLIGPLSTARITALRHENGVKITQVAGAPASRARIAGRLAEALLAAPAFAQVVPVPFHGDPHAGNLLYDAAKDEIVILDWALTERLSREQLRQIARLLLMTALRDAGGIWSAIDRLCLRGPADSGDALAARTVISKFLSELPLHRLPGAIDALRLLDAVARAGIRFPAPLAIFRKAAFTLDGVMEDVAGAPVQLDSVLMRYVLAHWPKAWHTLLRLLSPADWAELQASALTFGLRIAAQTGSAATLRRAAPLSAK